VIWRDRLYLFWVTFVEKAGKPVGDSTASTKVTDLTMGQVAGLEPSKQVDVQLHWCEYLNGEWTTQEAGGMPMATKATVTSDFTPGSVFVHVSLERGGDGVYVHLGDPIGKAFFLARRNSAPELMTAGEKPRNLYSADDVHATQYEGKGPFQVTYTPRIVSGSGRKYVPKATPTILRKGDTFRVLPCDNDIALSAHGVAPNASDPKEVEKAIASGLQEIAALMKPVFYQDARNTFYVEPTVNERTIEEWQEWVTTPARDEGREWELPDWWREIVAIPQIPKKKPVLGPNGPVEDIEINPKAQHVLKRSGDWLVNPGTVLRFDGELVDSKGQAGVKILTAADAGPGSVLVDVHPGSGLATNEKAVFTAGAFKLRGGGLNIVGGSGFNAALAKNFETFGR
jgi:hypothetical protein